jgi:hypothetical protein
MYQVVLVEGENAREAAFLPRQIRSPPVSAEKSSPQKSTANEKPTGSLMHIQDAQIRSPAAETQSYRTFEATCRPF